MFRSCGSAPGASSRAWLCANTSLSPAKYEAVAETPEKPSASGTIAIPPPGANTSPTTYPSATRRPVNTVTSATVRQRFAATAS